MIVIDVRISCEGDSCPELSVKTTARLHHDVFRKDSFFAADLPEGWSEVTYRDGRIKHFCGRDDCRGRASKAIVYGGASVREGGKDGKGL